MDPKLAKSRKRQLKEDSMDTGGDANKRQRKDNAMDTDVISEEDRLQFEEEFKDFDFSDLSEQDQEMQELAMESAEAIEDSIEKRLFITKQLGL